jgi:hypothetical protein
MGFRESIATQHTLTATSVAFRPEEPAVYQEDDCTILAHAGSQTFYRLNATGQYIWSLLEQPITCAALCEHVMAEFAVQRQECEAVVSSFLEQLRTLGFIAVRQMPDEPARLRQRYLDLLKRALVNLIYPEHELRIRHLQYQPRMGSHPIDEAFMYNIRYRAAEEYAALVAGKQDGAKASKYAHTLIGLKRLHNLEYCAEQVFANGIPGDFLEAGVWQGGAAIFLRALQVAFGAAQRRTWVADSFQGLPSPVAAPDLQFNMGVIPERVPWLAVCRDTVVDNFRTYDLLSEQVCFLEGWFADTLPLAPIEQLAILRIDADFYQSTREVLETLYDKVAPGGFVIVDDYHAFLPCQMAVDEFRAAWGIHDRLRWIDRQGVYWQKCP